MLIVNGSVCCLEFQQFYELSNRIFLLSFGHVLELHIESNLILDMWMRIVRG